ncbi:MAG: glycosyltransferase family 2 protein [Clostridia bacterium]|nr:glycosyltransferase family 2 protein [Clostridia bacterium]
MKLSLIVCIYNTPKEYFESSLKSVYHSTLKDFEVIVIDDGSTVDYSEIVKKYNPVYVKTENRGQLAARLFGLMLAKGEYVAFFDSDDTVSFNYHMPMVREAIESGADIVLNDWAFHTDTFRGYCKADATITQSLLVEGDDILKFFTSNEGKQHSYFVLWNKVFKRDLLMRAKAEIEATDAIMHRLTYSEDVLISFFAFKLAKKLTNVHTGYYFYRVHSQQIVNVENIDKLKAQIDMMSTTFSLMLDNVGDNSHSEEIKKGLLGWKQFMSRTHYSYAKSSKNQELFDYICEKYDVSRLKEATLKDSVSYVTSGLLGQNFEEIDNVLWQIYEKNTPLDVCYNKKDAYVAGAIEYLGKHEDRIIAYSKDAKITVPKQNISLKTRILHSKFVCTLGMVLFKKGSKTRAFLKKHF